MSTDGRYETLSKKEIARAEKERRKLQKNLEGIRGMSRLPDAVFVVDTKKEKIAVDEARKLKIPVIGIVDTNCDPDEVDFVIPGNDDALRAIRLFASKIADSIVEGSQLLTDKQSAELHSAVAAGASAEAGHESHGGEAIESEAGEASGDDISMEDVLGGGTKKAPATAKQEEADEVPQVESQTF